MAVSALLATSAHASRLVADGVLGPYPGQAELTELIERRGPPDAACGYVANADLIVEVHCGELTEVP
jgi:hypothetical protein